MGSCKVVGIIVLLITVLLALCLVYTKNSPDANNNNVIVSNSTYSDGNDKLLLDSSNHLSAKDIKNIMLATDSEVGKVNNKLDGEFYRDYYDKDVLRFRYFSHDVDQESFTEYDLYYASFFPPTPYVPKMKRFW